MHLLTEHARDESQYQQGQRIGHNSSPHRNTHTAVTRHPVSNHDRIGYQGVRGIHTGQQNGSHQAVFQEEHIADDTHRQGKNKCRQPQRQRLPTNPFHVLHIHLQTGQKHDVIQAHVPEQFKTAVLVQHMQTVWPNQHTGQNHADNVGYLQFTQ